MFLGTCIYIYPIILTPHYVKEQKVPRYAVRKKVTQKMYNYKDTCRFSQKPRLLSRKVSLRYIMVQRNFFFK